MPDELARLELAGIQPLTWAKIIHALSHLSFLQAGWKVHMPSCGKRNNGRPLP